MCDEEFQVKKEIRCKCCWDNAGSHYLWVEYFNKDEREVYGEMLMDCFALWWESKEEEMICESCINRLREAVKLKIEFLAVQELLQEENIKEELAHTEVEVLDEDILKTVQNEQYSVDEELGQDEPMDTENLEFIDDVDDEDYEPEVTQISTEQEESNQDTQPRKYPKKKKRSERKMYKMYNREDMKNAKEAVRVHGLRISEAAKKYGVPKKTLTAKLTAAPDGNEEEKDTTEEKQLRLYQEIGTIIKYTNALPFKTKTTKYYCAYCSTDGPFFEDPDELREHTRSEHAHELIRQVEQIMRPAWLNEILKMDITELQCSVCKIMITDWNSMFLHFAEAHDIEFDVAYSRVIPYSLTSDLKCVLCLKSFLNFGQLDAHMNSHYSNYICYECGDIFLANSRLEKHLKVHKVGKYPCESCDKVFSLELYRTKHVNLVHNQVCNVKCLYCPEKFLGTLLRHQHVLEKHPDKVKVMTCEYCGKTFTWKPYFITHKKMAHLKEKKYECTECGKSFGMNYELRNHMVRHKNKKNFICGMCGIAFKKLLDLKTHWKGHKRFNFV